KLLNAIYIGIDCVVVEILGRRLVYAHYAKGQLGFVGGCFEFYFTTNGQGIGIGQFGTYHYAVLGRFVKSLSVNNLHIASFNITDEVKAVYALHVGVAASQRRIGNIDVKVKIETW